MCTGIFYKLEKASSLNDEDYRSIHANLRHKFVNFDGYRRYDEEFKHINLSLWDEKSKILLAASVMQWSDIDSFTKEYPNLEELKSIKPLKENWILDDSPIFVGRGFKHYRVIV